MIDPFIYIFFGLWISFTLSIAIIPLGFLLAILSAGRATALPDVGKCTFMEYFCDAMKCQTVFVKTLQKDPNGDCRYRTVVRNAKKLSVIEAGRLRECKNTEFVWELRKTGVAKAAIKRAVHLLECAEESFHCACALLAVQLFLNISPHYVPWHALIPVFTATFFSLSFLSKWDYISRTKFERKTNSKQSTLL